MARKKGVRLIGLHTSLLTAVSGLLLVYVPILRALPAPMKALDSNDVAQRAIEEDARSTLQLHNEPIFLTRRPDLEEGLVSLQFILRQSSYKRENQTPVKCLEIFDVKREGFKVENNVISSAAVDLDDAPMWRSAYDCQQKKIFHLYGFPDDQSGIRNLLNDLDLRLHSESDALVIASDFTRLTSLTGRDTIVRDELSLMATFIHDYDGPRNWKAFNASWNKCPIAIKHQIASPSASSVPQGYQVMLFIYEQRTISKISILVTSAGQLSVESKKLFTWAK